jgi:hypothetical protein
MEALLVLMTVLVPIIMGLDEILKTYIPEKFHKLIPIIVGLVLAPFGGTFAPGLSMAQMVWAGFLAGMAACGSYKPTLTKKD